MVAVSGAFGAGKSLKTHLLAAELMGSAMPYSVGGIYRHIPEIVQNLSIVTDKAIRLSFTPILVAMQRGILATCSAPSSSVENKVRRVYEEFFAAEPFVTVLPEGQWPTTAAVVGSNHAVIQVTVDEAAGQLIAVCAIDNLAKGTAGGAVQSMNLALGLSEELEFTKVGVAP